jgi:hypothetical protein
MNRFSDQMPQAVWPAGRFVFFAAAGVFILLEFALLVAPVRSGASMP